MQPTVLDCSTNSLGCWTAAKLVTTSRWATNGDFSYDLAFAVVGPGGLDGATGLEIAIDSTAGGDATPAQVGFNRSRGEFLASFGYPQAPPYDGQDLFYCAGDAQAWDRLNRRFLNSYDQGLKCDLTGGSSGGPWYAEFDTVTDAGIATSVNSFKYLGDDSTMYGPYFGNYAQKVYLEAVDASGSGDNATVGPPNSLP